MYSDTGLFTNDSSNLSLTESSNTTFGGASGTLGALISVDSTQTGSVTFDNGGTIRLAGVTVASGAGAVTFSSTSGYNISGGSNNPTTNTFTNNSANTLTFSGNLQQGGSGLRTLDFTGSGEVNVSGVIGTSPSNGLAVQKDGTGLFILGGTNGYIGATTLNAGITRITNGSALGTAAAGTTVNSGATLQLQNGITVSAEALTISGTGAAGGAGALENNSGSNTYGGLVTLGADSTIAADNGTTLNLSNSGTVTGSGFNLTLVGSGTGSLASAIGTGAGGLSKTGVGSWTLSGANTYTGTTAVSAGTLLVNNAIGSGTSAGTVTVSAGANLGGTGTINTGGNAINIGNGATGGTITGGTIGTVGTLTLTTSNSNGVYLNGNSTSLSVYSADVTSAGTDKLAIMGLLNLSGSNDELLLNNISTPAAGTYQLATYSSESGAFNTVMGLTANETLVYNSNGTELDLVVAAVPESATWIGGLIGVALAAYKLRKRTIG